MRIRMRYFLIVLGLCLAQAVLASTAVLTNFKREGKRIPITLLRLGYDRFGSLDLNELIHHIDAIPLKLSSPLDIMSENSDGRPSGHWEIGKNGAPIAVSEEFWQMFSEAKPIFALHEYLGASGFNDRDYRLSTALWVLSTTEAQSNLAAAEKEQIENYVRAHSQYAGIIGVGGGGDAMAIATKENAILKNFRRMKSSRPPERRQQMEVVMLILDMKLNLQWKQGQPNR